MSRILKRVPPSFDWPLNQCWGGYLNPYYTLVGKCPDCDHGYDRVGGRPDANAALFKDQWYGNALFNAFTYGAKILPLTQEHPAYLRALRNVKQYPEYYMSSEEHEERAKFQKGVMEGFPHDQPFVPFPDFNRIAAIDKEARRLHDLWRNQWSHHLIQADVDALIAADRLWDFTRVARNDEQREVIRKKREAGENNWMPYNNGYHPTAEEVNLWSYEGFGHDSFNQHVCVEARCLREGVPYMCVRCQGSGTLWPTPQIKQQYDDWKPTDPPTGEGYQLWETCSEGSPVSPVFTSLDALCEWAAKHATTFAHFKASADEWKAMLDNDYVHATDEKGNIFV